MENSSDRVIEMKGNLRKISYYGSEVLRKKALPIDEIDDSIKELASDMVYTMFETGGVGLAAPQVGISKRLVVLGEFPSSGELEVTIMVNPKIIDVSKQTQITLEGCLSLPGASGSVERFQQIKVAFKDLFGDEHELEFLGFRAAVVQHEVDHLDGILYIDRLSSFKRSRALKSFKKEMKKRMRRS